MKRLLILLALTLLLPCIAAADTAEDITTECIVNNRAYNKHAPDDIRDGDYITFFTGSAVTIQA
ncbi:MAG: hypothetical protein IJ343_10000, partial [Clostridia bacterium]|nr:hypothetical protein [Clostridia bacterium]